MSPLNKIKQQAKTIADNAKVGISGVATNVGIVDTNKSKLKLLVAEKTKMYEFIGIEIYDLFIDGKICMEEIEPFCKKIKEISAEIGQLQIVIAKEANICECGGKNKKGARFCISCGKAVVGNATKTEACICGEKLIKGNKFCASCGNNNNTQQALHQCIERPVIRECVCGAALESDVKMCMECGRRVAPALS